MSLFGFDGKRVVITGCFSGMGRAAVERLLADGAEVHALDIKRNDLPVASHRELDLRDPVAIGQVTEDLLGSVDGPIDAVFNCAGLPHSSFPAPDIMQVNFFGLRQLTEGLLTALQPGSSVSHIASKSGINWPEQLETIQELLALPTDDEGRAWFDKHTELHENAYGFSKACVIVYTMARAAQISSRGIRMNSIAPGATDTPMMEHFRKGRTEEQLSAATGGIGRMSRPEEQAYPLLFLGSEAASYVSGVTLVVDGGSLGGFITGELTPPTTANYANVRAVRG